MMNKELIQFSHVIEFELKDSVPNVFVCVEEFLRKIISAGLLNKAVLINSRFLHNAKAYNFGSSPNLSLPKREVEARLPDIVSSCVDKGHLSCVLVLSSIPDSSYFFGYEKNNSQVDFFLTLRVNHRYQMISAEILCRV